MRSAGAFSPPQWLAAWLDHIPHGRALELGAGTGELAAWLSQRGFIVSAVERDPGLLADLQQLGSEESFEVIKADLREFSPPPTTYSLIIASAVLHFLLPEDLFVVADRLKMALRPGGFLMAEVFTIDDPSYRMRAEEQKAIAARTFNQLDRLEPIHYFEKGELRQLFSELQILSYSEDRRLDHSVDAGFRAGAMLVARRLDH